MTPRVPTKGDPLLLDGFEYELGGGKQQKHDDGRTVTIRSFYRPGVLDVVAASAKAAEAKVALRDAKFAGDTAGEATATSQLQAASAAVATLEAVQVPLRANFNYKKDGTCLDEDLVWADPPQLVADLKSQANQLKAGNVRLAAWATGAVATQEAALAGRTTGAWTLADRHLLKPPTQLRLVNGKKQEVTVVPSSEETAKSIAASVLAHTHLYDVTKEG